MDNELEKIDIIRSRYKIGYQDARDVLNAAEGDIVTALAALEKSPANQSDLVAIAADMVDEVQKLVDGGPIRKVRVRYGNRLVTETPVALTAAAALAVGIAALLISRLIIEVDRD